VYDSASVSRGNCLRMRREQQFLGAVAVGHAQRVEHQDVRRAFPDRQHLRVAEEPRQRVVFDVAVASYQFHGFGDARHGQLAGDRLHDRREKSQQPRRIFVACIGAVRDLGVRSSVFGFEAESKIEGLTPA
jgi:hypothetical protein